MDRRSASPAAGSDSDVDRDVYDLLRQKSKEVKGLKRQLSQVQTELQAAQKECKHLATAKQNAEQLLISQDEFASPEETEHLLRLTQHVN